MRTFCGTGVGALSAGGRVRSARWAANAASGLFGCSEGVKGAAREGRIVAVRLGDSDWSSESLH
jgi:hypothetical protein